MQEATETLSAAKEMSVGAAVVAVLAELDRIFTLKQEQRTARKAFCQWIVCFCFDAGWWCRSRAAPRTNRKPRAGAMLLRFIGLNLIDRSFIQSHFKFAPSLSKPSFRTLSETWDTWDKPNGLRKPSVWCPRLRVMDGPLRPPLCKRSTTIRSEIKVFLWYPPDLHKGDKD